MVGHTLISNNQNDGWDGNFNGRAVEVGVYVYVVEYTDFAGQKKVIKKDLTLLR